MKKVPLVVSVTLLASAISTFAGSSWKQYGFNASHSSFNSGETILNRTNVSQLTFDFGARVRTPTAPIVGEGMIFVASDGRIVAFDARTGAKVWGHLSCSGQGTQQAALDGQRLFVGDGGDDLAAYDAGTGAQIWCDDESGSITSPPAVHGDSVYITNGTDVVAVDQATGTRLWSFTAADFAAITNTPAYADGVVYATGTDTIFALDANTGKKIWRVNIPTEYRLSAPAVGNGIVYVGGTELFALAAFDGHFVWIKSDVGTNISTPALADGKVFVNSEDPQFGLHAFNATTGNLVWKRPNRPGESDATVTVANGVVYDVGEFGQLLMFNSGTGERVGKLIDPGGLPFDSGFGAQPAVANGAVYISTGVAGGANRVDVFRLP
ncbi:MAG: PQQ-binding-like beta-propeller repeat protein [Chthoniobacterales bacterium]